MQTPLGPNTPVDAPTLAPPAVPVKVSVLPTPVHMTAGVAALVKLAGYASLKLMPLMVAVALGLVSMIVSVDVPPS